MALNDLLSPHFRLSEFMSKDGADTPDSVLDDLRRQAALLEVIRSAAGDRPISINSGYRSPSHNTAVGGATHSQHPLGTAADFNVQGMQPRAVSELVTGLIDQGKLPSGGLGVYDNWVHYDHRPNGNARWAEDGGPVPPRARVQMNVAGSLGQRPEVMGAASGAFEQTPQGQIPAEGSSAYRPDIRELGMGVTEALMRDIGANAGSFNYPDQLAKRNATAQNLLDRYSKSDDMSAGDIPGAVLAAPVNIAKHLLSPLRRALGNREQLQTDAWSGDQGLDAIAAFSGNPELVDKYRETPGAGDWLKSLVTDSAERKAAAARGVISRLALSDVGADGQGKAYLTAAQIAAAKANAIQSLLGGYNQTADTVYGQRLKDRQGRQADAAAYANTEQGLLSAANRIQVPRLADAEQYKDNMAGYASKSRGDENYTKLPPELDLINARVRATDASAARSVAQINAGKVADALRGMRESRLQEKDNLGIIRIVQDAVAAGTMSQAAGNALLERAHADGFTVKDNTTSLGGVKNFFTGGDPTLRLDYVTIPRGNVGGAEGAGTNVSPEQAHAIQNGEANPTEYADKYLKGMTTEQQISRIAKDDNLDDGTKKRLLVSLGLTTP